MTVNKIAPASIANIEQQITKVTLALEKARAHEFARAEKAFLAAQKATNAAQARVDALEAKAASTPAALARLNKAYADLATQQAQLDGADEIYSALLAAQEATKKFAADVAKVMAGKKLGKKIKFTKQEKKVIKEDEKAEKKRLKQEEKKIKKETKATKKAEKQNAKAESQKNESVKAEAVAQTTSQPATKAKPAAKKTVAKKATSSPAPVKTEVIAEPSTLAVNEEPLATETPAKNLPEPITVDNTPTPTTSSEPEASETGKDVVIETEVLPSAESVPRENVEKPVND